MLPLAGDALRFTGRRLDQETGLYYYRMRYYLAPIGRFTQEDPIGDLLEGPERVNLYSYVTNNPLNLTDPTGGCNGNDNGDDGGGDGDGNGGTTPDGVDLGPTNDEDICCTSSFSVTKRVRSTTTSAQGIHVVTWTAKDSGEKNGKCCEADCCLYRQHVKGHWRTSKGGSKRYTLSSCGNVINMENWVEEYTSCIRGGTPTNRRYTDGPGWGSGLADGVYREFHLEFKYRLWDTCQGRWESSSDTGTLDISGDKHPRSITYN